MKTVGITLLCLWLFAPALALAAAPLPDGTEVDRAVVAIERGEMALPQGIALGRGLAEKGQVKDARRVLEALAKKAPQDPQPPYWLGQILIMQRQFDEGLALLEKSVALAPANLVLKMELVKAYDVAGRPDAGEPLLRELAQGGNPKLAQEARYRLNLLEARKAVKAGDLERARTLYEALLRETPGDIPVIEQLATILETLHRYDESDRLFQQLVEHAPDDLNLRLRLAATYQARPDVARAEAQYAEVLKRQPSGPFADLALDGLGFKKADERLRSGKPAEALDILQHILSLAPDSVPALLGSALALRRLERYDEADKVYTHVLELDPQNVFARLERAQLYEEADRLDQAVEAYEGLEHDAVTDAQRRIVASHLNNLYGRKLKRLADSLQRGHASMPAVSAFGDKLVQRGYAGDAVRLLETAAVQAPDDGSIHLVLGKALMAMRDAKRGIPEIERAATLLPKDVAAATALAQAYESVGRIDDAERAWQDATVRAGDDAATRGPAERGLGLLRARRLDKAHDYDGALHELDQLIAKFPDDLDLISRKAGLLLALKRDKEADEVLAQTLTAKGPGAPPYLEVAGLYAAAGRNGRAERVYKQAIEAAPADVAPRIALGRFYASHDRFEEAYATLNEAAKGATGVPRTQVDEVLAALPQMMTERGSALLSANKPDEAEKILKAVLDRQPKDEQALLLLSEVYRAQGHYADQAAELAKVVAAQPKDLAIKRQLALAYANAGMFTEAEPVLAEVVEAFPYDAEMRLWLAQAHEHRGDVKGAHEEYARLLSLNPPAEWRTAALDNLGLKKARADFEAGRIKPAQSETEQVLAEAPDQPAALLLLGRIAERAGRLEDAESTLRKAAKGAPDDPDIRLALARVLAARGEEKEAKDIYFKLASEPRPQADDARKELNALMSREARQAMAAVEGQAPVPAAGAGAGPPAETKAPGPGNAEAAKDHAAPSREAALLAIGTEALHLEANDAAGEVFERLIKLDPQSAEAQAGLGRVYMARKEYPNALLFLKQAVALAPKNAEYRHALGLAYKELSLDRSAGQFLKEAADLAPDDIGIAFDLADFYQRHGDEADARAEYLHILERADAQEALRALAALRLGADPNRLEGAELDNAVAVFDAAHFAPQTPQMRLYLAIAYQRAQRLKEAEKWYDQVMASAPPPIQAQAGLGLAHIYTDSGRTQQAMQLLERVVQLEPRMAARARQQEVTTILLPRAEELQAEAAHGAAEPGKAIQLGALLVKQNAQDQAVPLLEVGIRAEPNNPEALYWLGRAYVERGHFDKGIPSLERSADLAPNNLVLRRYLALAYDRAGQKEKAAAAYEQLVRQEKDPKAQLEARMNLGRIRTQLLAGTGDLAGALAECEAMLQLAPDDVGLIGERGHLLEQLGRHQEADAAIAKILTLAPNNAAIRLKLADIYHGRGDTAHYVEQLAAAIRIDPRGPEATKARSLLGLDNATDLLAKGKAAEAETILHQALTAIPNDPLTRFDLARAYYQERRYPEAEGELQAVTQAVPDFPEPWFLLGQLYEVLDRSEAAIDAYEHVLRVGRNGRAAREAQPRLVALYLARVQTTLKANQGADAMQWLTRLTQSDPANVPARSTFAALLTRAKRYDDALRVLEPAVRLQPDNPRIRDQLAAIYIAAGRPMDAAEAWSYAVSLEQDSPERTTQVRQIVGAVATALVARGRPFAAIRQIKDLIDEGLGDERTYIFLASLYREQGRMDEATRAFQEAVQMAPDNNSARFSLAELYERNTDYEPALAQYGQIARKGPRGDRVVEEARRRANSLDDRLARFSSQLSYTTTMGQANIADQDLSHTGALNTKFSSQLYYNLGTNFWPTSSLNLRLDTGISYITNHTQQLDTLSPRMGITGNLTHPLTFYSMGAHFSDMWDLVDDVYQGRFYDASASAGIRFNDLRDLIPSRFVRPEFEPRGEPSIERAPLEAAGEVQQREIEETYQEQAAPQAGAPAAPILPLRIDGAPDAKPGAAPSAPPSANPHAQAGPLFDRLRGAVEETGPGEQRAPVAATPPPLASAKPSSEGDAKAKADEGAQRQALLDRLGFQHAIDALNHRRPGPALKILQRIEKELPNDPLIRLNIGVARDEQGRTSDAEPIFQALLDDDPRNLTARLRLAMLYAETNRIDRALALLEQVTSEGQDRETARRAQDILDRIEDRRRGLLLGDERDAPSASMKTLQASFFWNNTDLPVRSISDTMSYGTSLNFFYRSLGLGSWNAGYTFGVQKNKDPLGTDYSYDWNTLSLTWSTSVPNVGGWFGPSAIIPGLTGSVTVSREWRHYTFVDTNAFNVLSETKARRRTTDTITLGLNWQPPGYERLSFFANYTRAWARSNLPVGIVFSPDGIPVTPQSNGLGNFDPSYAVVGVGFHF